MKKNKIIEIIIISIIIITLIITLIIATKILSDSPKKNENIEETPYSVTKIYQYNKQPSNASKYQIPLITYIIPEYSTYLIEITATDNIIHTYKEQINLKFNNIPETGKNSLINYCNEYDDIESEYKLQCTYKNNVLTINNTFNLPYINSTTIKSDYLTITIPLKKDTKLDEYLDTLNKNNITYTHISTK